MFVYSSNSPYFLDYVASACTRQEILDDPTLCHLLEDPFVKDNVELALRWKESKNAGGDGGSLGSDSYEKKREFLEYFLANGPELDPDTILYYREKCMLDPVYAQIAERMMVDIGEIDYVRTEFYGKPVDEEDCYNLPCNYLEPMNAQVGMMGDCNNFLTLTNIFAKLLNNKKGKAEDNKNRVGEGTKDEDGEENVWGHIRQHVTQKIIPSVRESIQSFYNLMGDEMKEFSKRCVNAGIHSYISVGDPCIIDRAELISASTKSNVYTKLGDCARIWKQLRMYNPYDTSQNQKGPISDSDIIANKSTQGTSIDNTPPTSIGKRLAPSNLTSAAAQGDKTAQAIKKLNELKWCYTADDVAKLKLPDSEFSREEKLELINRVMNEANTSRAAYREAELKLKQEAGIADEGNDYVRWLDARDASEAKNEEIGAEFIKLANAIRMQENGNDYNTPSKSSAEETSENDVSY